MQNQFRLDELLARDVVPEWYEGVAAVQLICRQLLGAHGSEATGFPHPAEILIAPGGLVRITGRSSANAVENAAHVLGLMLGNDVPVRLRLSLTQATAADGGYRSLKEFSEALAYFERPNPESLVEAFRQRAMTAAPREVKAPTRGDTPTVIEKQLAPVQEAVPRGVNRFAVIAAAFAALACASIWLIGHRVPELLTPKVGAAEANVRPTQPGRARAKAPTKSGTALKPERVSTAGSPTTASALEPKRSTPRSILTPAPDVQVVATTLSYDYPESLPGERVTDSPVLTAPGTPDDVLPADQVREISDRIYSKADRQVTWPLSVYPKLPSEPPGTPLGGRTIMELTIGVNGLVESVRMLSTPRNIHEFMMLSAAKSWRFEPARIAGRAVRFRQTMALTSVP